MVNLTTLQLANKRLREGQYLEAIDLYQEAVKLDPRLQDIVVFNHALAERKLAHQTGVQNKTASDVKIDLANVIDSCQESAIFDSYYYLENNEDVREAKIDPEKHYWEFGEREGRRPNAYFDPVFYARLNADVRQAKISPFRHFVEAGRVEGRISQSPLGRIGRITSWSTKPLLFVGHDGVLAGSEIVLLEIIRWFHDHTLRRLKVLLLAPGPVADRYAQFADVYVLPGKEVDSPHDLKNFLDENFEFAYLNTVVSGRLFSILRACALDLRTNIVAHIHEMEKVLAIFGPELEALQDNVHHWISASPASTEILVAKHGLSPGAITTVPAFIKPIARKEAIHNELQSEARRELGLQKDSFVVAGCGTLYWRKGPDIFLQTARLLKAKTQKPIEFVWLGQGPDRHELEESLSVDEKHWIHFAGNRTDANRLLAAADVFYMCSREDPFPLVVLESAQHGIPTVCFAPATGITAFIENDAGIATDGISAEHGARAIQQLLDDPEHCRRLGDRARRKLFAKYTAEQQNLKIFDVICRHTTYRPSVSVIVPFYNHERFIEERLKSILRQQIKDIEIIALDDCSTDATIERVKPYLVDKRIRLIENTVNSGSPFKQWKKGIDVASGEIIWIAEGDDICSENFLSTLLQAFEDPLVNIAYSAVDMVDEHGTIIHDAFKPYFESASPGKFYAAYTRAGIDEVAEHFGAYQTLINASGLLIRKSSFGVALHTARNYKMCGDWLVYLECMKRGKVAYCPSATNYFRRHEASQVVKIEGTKQYFQERFEVTRYTVENYPLTHKQLLKAFNAVDHEWARFKHKNPGEALEAWYDKRNLLDLWQQKYAEKSTLPSLLVVVSDLSPGGGQLFSIRLANAWHALGGNTILVNVGKHLEHPQVRKKVDPGVTLFNFRDINLPELARIYDIDIVHSSVWWADRYVHESYTLLPEKVRWVVSTHGCYEALLEAPKIDQKFEEYFQSMLYEVDHWVYTAEKNRRVFKKYGSPPKMSKILNGYQPELPVPLEKSALGIREKSVIVCLASRAMEDKGWFVAVDAVQQLNEQGLLVDLLLIGEGPAADAIRERGHAEYIHLIGQVANLQDYIAISDVGLLPSMFVSESMPLVLIEFMAQGKPMVATDIGEIRCMTQDIEGAAARVMPLTKGKVDVAQLVQELGQLCRSADERQLLGAHSRRRFQYFEMSNMLKEYCKIYHEVMS